MKTYLSRTWLLLVVVLGVLIVAGGVFFTTDRFATPPLTNDNAEEFVFEETAYSESHLLGDGYRTFTHPTLNFRVDYPDTYATTAFRETDNGETIIFQEPDGGKKGFQIFITPFGEDVTLTRERILKDISTLAIDEPQEAVIGNAIHALIFFSNDPRIGQTREVWFTNKGYLYEVTTYAEYDTWLAHILSSWRFE